MLAQLENKPDAGAGAGAAAFLQAVLKDGPQMAVEIIAKGKTQGLSEWALRRALKKLGGAKEKASFKGAWIWELP